MAQADDQIKKFKKAARDLETDDSEDAFNEKLGKIARQKPDDPEVKKSAKRLTKDA